MKIPSSLIQNFITSEFTDAKLVDGKEYHFNSPFETRDKKRKCYISKYDGRWTDYKAHMSGGFLSFIKEYCGLNNYNEAINYLVNNYNFVVDINKTKEEKLQDETKRKILLKFIKEEKPKLFGNGEGLMHFGKQAYEYVLSRKLDESYYPTLGYINNPGSKYDKRIFIPFFEDDKIVYCITRAVDKDNLIRYLNINTLDSKEYVFNIDKINEELIICEGTFDAMSITAEQAATCLLSADVGTKQLEKIFDKEPKTIIYVPDQDETGIKKMNSNIKKILTYCPYSGLDIYIYNVPKGCKDLNDMKIKTGKNYILKKECTKYNGSCIRYE